MIVEATQGLLQQNFGKTEAKAIDCYADAEIAITNPEEYTGMFLNIFGAGTEHLLASTTVGLGEQSA